MPNLLKVKEERDKVEISDRIGFASTYEKHRPQYEALCRRLCNNVRNMLNKTGLTPLT